MRLKLAVAVSWANKLLKSNDDADTESIFIGTAEAVVDAEAITSVPNATANKREYRAPCGAVPAGAAAANRASWERCFVISIIAEFITTTASWRDLYLLKDALVESHASFRTIESQHCFSDRQKPASR
ncbi:hypothetical protein [Burkholderia sp. Leaf177]|uniref:hypothetical protein n=1 Tax=Burkholderia sp. Leaf177 TaxID=1736287 RepID=UPI00138ECD86|nr:hypothetical protein [Burkholderia sp. Leaf177]